MRLAAYLLLAFFAVYAANIPVHHGLMNPIVPALVPWAASAGDAIWRFRRMQNVAPAWLTLLGLGGFLRLGHYVPE